jgi:hypothetical protein
MLMRRRLYFLLPDIPSARATMNELLLARIEVGHVHLLARRDMLPDDLPAATVLQKTDVVHGARLGALLGGIAGACAGVLFVMLPPSGAVLPLGTILFTSLFGAAFGAWASSLAGAALPNSQLRRFHAEIDRGQVLMMVDVPMRRVEEITDLVARRRPEARSGGFEPTIPAFP